MSTAVVVPLDALEHVLACAEQLLANEGVVPSSGSPISQIRLCANAASGPLVTEPMLEAACFSFVTANPRGEMPPIPDKNLLHRALSAAFRERIDPKFAHRHVPSDPTGTLRVT